GLSVLTGETGAGKSVVVNALALALGGRADRELIRHGADSCKVTATFENDGTPLEITRDISRSGNSKIKINNAPANLTQLRASVSPLAQIFGQHSGQLLLDEDNHLGFLDNFGSLSGMAESVGELYRQWKSVGDELRLLRNRREQLKTERELLLFQRDEIEKAQIVPGEEEKLQAERKVLDSARALMASSSLVQDILAAEEQSVATMLSLAARELEKMAAIDKSLSSGLETAAGLQLEVEELRALVERYGSGLQDDPHRIEQINLRLDEIYNLKKKYGGSEDTILHSLIEITERLDDRPDVDSRIELLESEFADISGKYAEKAIELSRKRRKAAARLQKLILKELADLAIENGGFEFEFLSEDDPQGVIIDGQALRPYEHGLENGRILFSANPGEPLKSLVRTASGGEISRVFLALKSAEKANRSLNASLLVFDEVDDGIGGRTAIAVARKLKSLANGSQVLVITHLHQIGRVADHHFAAEKGAIGTRSEISVKKLSGPEVEAELARMVALPEEA
ncbi:MAG: hypothetical protein KAU36_09690, partial [candidate division Zixibacteria bacterium]|nr:hypothetical protein [candidate division Zixibacteria bacterium]